MFRASGESSNDNSSVMSDRRAGGDCEDDDEEQFEIISKSEVHLQINDYPISEDQIDSGNPFGGRLSTNTSLYFDDGKRSVDYVLVWKKLVPPDDDLESSEASKAKEIERQRAEKREVFHENLLQEGLQLESYVIDDEINFIKLHAPLEVLRRYAEILKLRLPMKEVSNFLLILH
jgi:Dimerisation domain of Ca+-activated chloride-channel, anoctamin